MWNCLLPVKKIIVLVMKTEKKNNNKQTNRYCACQKSNFDPSMKISDELNKQWKPNSSQETESTDEELDREFDWKKTVSRTVAFRK